jgi:hypothetical protein
MNLWVFQSFEDLDHKLQCCALWCSVVNVLEEPVASVCYPETSLRIHKAIWSQDSGVQNFKTRLIFGVKIMKICRRDER